MEHLKMIDLFSGLEGFSISSGLTVIVSNVLSSLCPKCNIERTSMYPNEKKIADIYKELADNCKREKLFKETSSDNKRKILAVFNEITENTEKEEIVKEIEEVIEENNIDRRIFNGKKAEEKFCEFINNDQVWQLIEQSFAKFMHTEMRPSSTLNRFLKAFAIAFYEELNTREGTWDGKTALLHRFAESRLGEKLTMTDRALQKGIAEIRDKFMGRIKERIDSWMEKFGIRINGMISLIKKIKAFLSEVIPTMITPAVD